MITRIERYEEDRVGIAVYGSGPITVTEGEVLNAFLQQYHQERSRLREEPFGAYMSYLLHAGNHLAPFCLLRQEPNFLSRFL